MKITSVYKELKLMMDKYFSVWEDGLSTILYLFNLKYYKN